MISITESAAWQLIMQTDAVSKTILVSLFLLSVACVAIIIYKILELRQEQQSLKKIMLALSRSASLTDCENITKMLSQGVGSKLLLSSIKERHQIGNSRISLSKQEKELFELKIHQQTEQLILSLESNMPVLGISGSVAPLIGLFGTVWGLVHAFIDISVEKTADIATVAPGIAEALMTTLAGLIVAIPAMIAFNYCAYRIRLLESQLYQVADIIVTLSGTPFSHKEESCHDVIGSSRAN